MAALSSASPSDVPCEVTSRVPYVIPEVIPIPRINDFAIISVPATKGPNKNFVGQVVAIYDDGRDGLQVSFLKKAYGKFTFPPTPDISWIRNNEIVKILDVPVTNKRNQFFFSELDESEIKIF